MYCSPYREPECVQKNNMKCCRELDACFEIQKVKEKIRQILFCFWTQFRAFKSKKALALNQRCLKFNMDNQTAPNIMAKDTYVTHCRGTTFKIKNAPGANRFWYAKPTSSICTLRKWSPRKQIPGGLFEKKPFSSQRWAGCLSFRVVQLTWIGLAYQNLLRHFLT